MRSTRSSGISLSRSRCVWRSGPAFLRSVIPKTIPQDWSDGSSGLNQKDRIWFTVFSCLIQYILPLLLISFVYFRIYKFLQTRRFQNATICERQKKTNWILLSISLIFLVRFEREKSRRLKTSEMFSWLPFSIFCIVTDISDSDDSDDIMIWYSVFHLVGMSSTCTNPILYGFLNEAISKEITTKTRKILRHIQVERVEPSHNPKH